MSLSLIGTSHSHSLARRLRPGCRRCVDWPAASRGSGRLPRCRGHFQVALNLRYILSLSRSITICPHFILSSLNLGPIHRRTLAGTLVDLFHRPNKDANVSHPTLGAFRISSSPYCSYYFLSRLIILDDLRDHSCALRGCTLICGVARRLRVALPYFQGYHISSFMAPWRSGEEGFKVAVVGFGARKPCIVP